MGKTMINTKVYFFFEYKVSCISWSPDGDKFVVGTDNLLLKWYCVAK